MEPHIGANAGKARTNGNLGDSFVAGDVILEIETDKAQMDVEAQDDGVLAKILVCCTSLHGKYTPGLTRDSKVMGRREFKLGPG